MQFEGRTELETQVLDVQGVVIDRKRQAIDAARAAERRDRGFVRIEAARIEAQFGALKGPA